MNNYPNKALTDVCDLLMEWEIPVEFIANLAADLPGEYAAMVDQRNEAAYERQQAALMESGGPDDSAYRRQMIDAGRGHLLKG